MGMFGTLGKAALNFAGRNLLGVDFERQKQLEAEKAQRDTWMRAVLGGVLPQESAGPPPPIMGGQGDITDAFGPQAAPAPKAKTYQDMLPLLTMGALKGYKGVGDIASMVQAAQPKPKTPLNTSQGVREYDPATGDYRHLEDFPQKPQPAPSGFRWKADGSGLELIPGYAEGVGKVGGVRREAITSRPMPRVGGGGHGGRSAKELSDAELLAIATGGK